MEAEKHIETPREQQPLQSVTPPIATPKSKRNMLVIIGISVIVILIGTVSFYLLGNRQISNSGNTKVNAPSSSSQKSNWKTYTNNYYNFKLDVPSDWKTEEYKLSDTKTIYENDDFQVYKLSSPNGELVISNDPAYLPSGKIKEQLPNTKVQLGSYTVDRYPFIDDTGKRKDGIALDNIKRQKLIRLDFAINGDMDKNNQLLLEILKTFAFTKQDTSLDDEVSYTIPQGWNKEDTDIARVLSFVSSDFKEEGLPTIVSGARISVNKVKEDTSKSLLEQVTLRSPYDNSIINTQIGNTKLGNNTYLNMIANCSKGVPCSETYSTGKDGYIWTVSFTCNQNCDTKAGMNNTIYARDRDAFLSSIQFK